MPWGDFKLTRVAFMAAVVAVLAGLGWRALEGSDSGNVERTVDSEWGFFRDARQLVDGSELIVVAEAGDGHREKVPLQSPVTGEVTGERIDELREYRVVEVVKGERVGAMLSIRSTISVRDRLPSGGTYAHDLQPPGVTEGRRYVLFLRGDSIPDTWVAAGLPWLAEERPETLVFKLSKDQRKGLRESGIEPGPSGAGPGLAVTLDDVRELARPPMPTPYPGTPIPAGQRLPESVTAARDEYVRDAHGTPYLGACADVKQPSGPGMCYRSARTNGDRIFVIIGPHAGDWPIWLLTFEKPVRGEYRLAKAEQVQGRV